MIGQQLYLNHKPAPNSDPEEEVDVATATPKEFELVLYNDDVNTFEHVIATLIAVCDHTAEQAEQCAYIVHFNGKCTVKTGSYTYLEPRCTLLLEAGLSASIV